MSVKEKSRGRPKKNDHQLSGEKILGEAKSLMKQTGKIPSIRGLAASLNVDAMAIYHYFSNKNALLEAITTSLIEDVYQPQETCNWQQELTKLSHSYLALLAEYPGLLNTLLSMESQSPAAVFAERYNLIIASLELDEETQKNGLDLLADYLHGFALALDCNNGAGNLTIEMLGGPLKLICSGLKNATD
ncbi:TetR family transcriptional regulator [Vibrio sp. T187]|uniref:TetR/AcrR family transcriptional regulator n=1 Tax=Vibrio TaxID=662 RepID=UPI0010C9B2AC|nr:MULTISPECIES: TetR/AcrR family transcriptional regulator [Vibrio]MBW3694503.1 TetR family transcriptional regulator [Vibrio sp. T187]